jgi:hypothetical protein
MAIFFSASCHFSLDINQARSEILHVIGFHVTGKKLPYITPHNIVQRHCPFWGNFVILSRGLSL